MRAFFGKWTLAIAGVLVGALLLSPVAAHVNKNFSHLWSDHIKPKADNRYVIGTESPWASINEDATIDDAEGVDDVSDEGTGDYLVVFKRNVRNCAHVVTTRGTNLIGSVQPLGPNNKAMEVVLVNTANNPVDSDFFIITRC
jgi:hypothetical protein